MRSKIALAVLISVPALVLAACSGDSPSASGESGTTTSVASTTTAEEVDVYYEGEPVTNGGITLTVNSATSPATYPRNETNYRKDSDYAVYTDIEPRSGGKFVRIDATVKNGTPQAIDLTCSLPVIAHVSDGDALYKPVDSLYEIEGTPDCNEDLNPGFESEMTWIFEVPETAEIFVFTFADYDLGTNSGEIIRLDETL